MSSPVGRMAEFEILSVENPETHKDLVRTMRRIDKLVLTACGLGAGPCRVRDDATGLEFRWKFVP